MIALLGPLIASHWYLHIVTLFYIFNSPFIVCKYVNAGYVNTNRENYMCSMSTCKRQEC